jgi:hypothetical protein
MALSSDFLKWFGLLSFVLIVVLYFKGSTALLGAFGTMIQTISYAWTGRNASGIATAYPTG